MILCSILILMEDSDVDSYLESCFSMRIISLPKIKIKHHNNSYNNHRMDHIPFVPAGTRKGFVICGCGLHGVIQLLFSWSSGVQANKYNNHQTENEQQRGEHMSIYSCNVIQ